jgi:hypothetical protein
MLIKLLYPSPRRSPDHALGSERIRIPHEYSWRGGGGLGFFRHDYCYISGHQCMYRVAHSVLEHRLGAPSVVTFITKRAGLLRSRRLVRLSCGRRLWRGRRPLRLEAVGAIGGELRAMLNMDFRELRKAEVEHRRIHLPRTRVNRGRSLAYSHRSSSMSWITAPPGGGPSPAENERVIRPLVASPDSTVFTESWVTSTPWFLSRS